MNKQSHEKYALSFGLGFLSLWIVLLPLLIMDKGYFIYYGDFNHQQLPFYALANDAVRRGELFGWNWYTDLGSSFLGSYAFYLTGSPFFWLTTILPEGWVLYAIPWLLCLKHAIASMTGYAYIRRFVKRPESAVIGGLLYAYSGFQLFNIVFNHFQDVTAFFPLMLIAMEELVNNNRRGWFAASVAFMAVISYFFFAGQVVFLILYFIIRCRSQDFHADRFKFYALAIEAAAGVCIACAIVFPAALAVLQNDRVSRSILGQGMTLYRNSTIIARIIQGFFMMPDRAGKTILFGNLFDTDLWKSIAGYLPLFSMAGVLAFVRQKKKHWASRMFFSCLICAIFPLLNSMFYMLNAEYYARWYYMPILIMAMMTAYALDSQEIQWRNGMKICAVVLSVFGIIALLQETQAVYFYVAFGISILCWFGTWYILRERKQKKQFWKKAIILTVSACIACTGTIIYFGKASEADFFEDYIETAIQGEENINISYDMDEADYFRIDIENTYYNYPMFWGLSNIKSFHSTVSQSITNFYDSIGIARGMISGADWKYYTIRGLFSVKYYLDNIKEGEKTLLGAQAEFDEFQEPDFVGFEYDRTENGYDIYINQYFIPMGFTYDTFVLEDSFLKVPLEDESEIREKMLIHALILNQEQKQKYQNILTEIDNPAEVSLTEQDYFEACEAHIAESCHDFTYDSHGFSAGIELHQPKMVFFSVPYDEGWTAEVNGNPVEIENVSGGLMAILCEQGENQIVFHYQLPGLKEGICITLGGILLLLIYLCFGKKLFTDQPHSKEYDYLSGVQASDIYIQSLNHSGDDES